MSLVRKADGRFSWINLQLDTLKRCRDQPTLLQTLNSLPQDLDQSYIQVLARIEPKSKSYAIRILTWLCFSVRTLSLGEVIHFTSLESPEPDTFGSGSWGSRLIDSERILTVFSSLMTAKSMITASDAHTKTEDAKGTDHGSEGDNSFDASAVQATTSHEEAIALPTYASRDRLSSSTKASEERNVSPFEEITQSESHLVHKSVKDFLISERIIRSEVADYALSPGLAHATLSIECLRYLAKYQSSSGTVDKPTKSKLGIAYAAMSWSEHARIAEQNECFNLVLPTASRMMRDSQSWTQILKLTVQESDERRNDIRWDYEDVVAPSFSRHDAVPFYQSAREGLLSLCRHFVELGVDINASIDDFGQRTALWAASAQGHFDIVNYLLEQGANVDSNVQRFGRLPTPLHSALMRGHTRVALLLIQNGANIWFHDDLGIAPLHRASQRGYVDVVHGLLEAGVNVNEKTLLDEQTALCLASLQGHVNMARLLLSRGADSNIAALDGRTALICASTLGSESRDESKHAEIINLLVQTGANVEWKDAMGKTALFHAVEIGCEKIVKSLIVAGADPTSQAFAGFSPLHVAAFCGYDRLIELLSMQGANVNVRGIAGLSPLQLAQIQVSRTSPEFQSEGYDLLVVTILFCICSDEQRLALRMGLECLYSSTEQSTFSFQKEALRKYTRTWLSFDAKRQQIARRLQASGAIPRTLPSRQDLLQVLEAKSISLLRTPPGVSHSRKDVDISVVPCSELFASTATSATLQAIADQLAQQRPQDSIIASLGHGSLSKAELLNDRSSNDLSEERFCMNPRDDMGNQNGGLHQNETGPISSLPFLRDFFKDPNEYFRELQDMEAKLSSALNLADHYHYEIDGESGRCIAVLNEIENSTSHVLHQCSTLQLGIINSLLLLQHLGFIGDCFNIVFRDSKRRHVAKVIPFSVLMLETFGDLINAALRVPKKHTLDSEENIDKNEEQIFQNLDRCADLFDDDFRGNSTTCHSATRRVEEICSKTYTIISVLSIGLLSFVRSHIGDFTETCFGEPCQQIRIAGVMGTYLYAKWNLACLDSFVSGPLWLFEYVSDIAHIAAGTKSQMGSTGIFLSTSIADFADLWGPVRLNSSAEDENPNEYTGVVRHIEVPGGVLCRRNLDEVLDSDIFDNEEFCHWMSWTEVFTSGTSNFLQLDSSKQLLIGASNCVKFDANSTSCRSKAYRESFEEQNIGTSKDVFKTDSLSANFGIGKFVTFGTTMTRKLCPGVSLRENIVENWLVKPNESPHHIPDLEYLRYLAVLKVSSCTGVRISIEQLLGLEETVAYIKNTLHADGLKYESLLAKHKTFTEIWKSSTEDHDFLLKVMCILFGHLKHTGFSSLTDALQAWTVGKLTVINCKPPWRHITQNQPWSATFAVLTNECLEFHDGPQSIQCCDKTESKRTTTALRTKILLLPKKKQNAEDSFPHKNFHTIASPPRCSGSSLTPDAAQGRSSFTTAEPYRQRTQQTALREAMMRELLPRDTCPEVISRAQYVSKAVETGCRSAIELTEDSTSQCYSEALCGSWVYEGGKHKLELHKSHTRNQSRLKAGELLHGE